MSRLGDKIKEERVKKGISPKQLAKKAGLAENFILDVESGKRILNEKQISQISKVLGKSLEENMEDEVIEEKKEVAKPSIVKAPKRERIVPVEQWEDALSNIIKKVPILDVNMEVIKGYRDFPIINKKVEGFHPDKLVYIEVPDQYLRGYGIHRGDYLFIYLNQELVNNSFCLVEYEGKRKIRRVKRIEGNRIQLLSYENEMKTVTKDIKDIKIIGRGIRAEMKL